jgi:hypothetical protein
MPRRHRQRAELGGVGAELIESHRDRDHGARRHPDVRPFDGKPRRVLIIEGFGGAADDFAEVGAGPAGLQQQVMSPPERQQAAFDSVLRVRRLGYVAKALRGDGALTVASVFLMR